MQDLMKNIGEQKMNKEKKEISAPETKIEKKKASVEEKPEVKVIYINLMGFLLSCVIILVGIIMLPIKLYAEKGQIDNNKIDITNSYSEQEVNKIIQEEDIREEIKEETANIQLESNVIDIAEELKKIEEEKNKKQKYYIQNVPFINQFKLGYPMGCEAVSATMAAKYAGYNVEVENIVQNTPTDYQGKRQETKTEQIETIDGATGEIIIENHEETIWVAENPFLYFVGDPKKDKTQGAYGCFAKPIVTALEKSNIPCTDISGSSIDVLYDYVKQGKPVIVWCRVKAQNLIEGVTWQYPDRKWRIC